ncbi:MAG: hypothetical protein M0R38_08345 [Bacteroidia bacterium]|nr:hypothetical protein [Bacteroidia bacterium]
MLNIDYKRLLIKEVKQNLYDKIEGFKKMLTDIEEASEGEEKNSSGDKYETGIEMLKQEGEKISNQLLETKKMLEVMDRMGISNNEKIGFGSVVMTSDKTFFISVSLGKLLVNGQEVLCISGVAPIAHAIKGKIAGEKFNFNNAEVEILQVV